MTGTRLRTGVTGSWLRTGVAGCTVEDRCREDVRNVGYVGYGRATDVIADARLASAGQSEGQEDLGIPSNLTVLGRRR